jgi:diguanylate cyclase (GGDEF)-like protein
MLETQAPAAYERSQVSTPDQPDFDSFLRVASVLNSSLDQDTVLRELMAGLENLLQPTHWSLLLIDDATGELVFTLSRGAVGEALQAHRLAPDEGIAGWVATNDRPLLLPDVSQDARFSRRMDELSGFRTRSIVAVPLRTRNRCIGVLELINNMDDRCFTEVDERILRGYADFAAIAIQNARTHAETIELTRTDLLTGLRNSKYFLACVQEAIERNEPFALVFFDMDRFKQLVDTHGHVRGSAALAEVGAILRQALVPPEEGCRFGGDEFALLLPGRDLAAAAARCRALTGLIAEHIFLVGEGLEIRLSASFGAAAFPDDAHTATSLLHEADARMYEAKRARGVART